MIQQLGQREKEVVTQVTIKKGRVIVDGMRQRPRCPQCSKPCAGTWKFCEGCGSAIKWEK